MTTGFFGKIPASGDFVARNLLPGMRPVLDRWLTRNWADLARSPEVWPQAGLRGVLDASPGLHAMLVIPSQDFAGRHFPLAFVVPCDRPDENGVDAWANGVLALTDGSGSADEIAQTVLNLPAPAPADTPVSPPQFWGDAGS